MTAARPAPPHHLRPREREAAQLAALDIVASGTPREIDGDFYLKGAHGTLAVAGALMADCAACGLVTIEALPGIGAVARLTDAGRALLRADDLRHHRDTEAQRKA